MRYKTVTVDVDVYVDDVIKEAPAKTSGPIVPTGK